MILSQRLAIGWRTLTAHSLFSVRQDHIFYGLQLSCHGAFRLHTTASNETVIPFRKQLKEEAKARRAAAKLGLKVQKNEDRSHSDPWELTVGIEVHAQLNTERKLFSNSLTSVIDEPNCHLALFDLAVPGSQPVFQQATLLPAVRAAVAFHCDVQRRSKFDRKHYFYQDQPAGYQLTQYYEPFAKDGHVTLFDYDGIAAQDYPSITIGIKQIQMEQDTAKTIQQPPDVMLLDFNRVGHPLIEIITLPNIHHAQTAAACVRKIQSILQAVNAVTTGMEMGGLRADVNVSVRRRGVRTGPHTYYGVTGLGQRTEIKNLSSFKAVEDAINAEKHRQVHVLEQGGSIEGETRGWTIGGKETEKLRSKEGEVDYRYMPDPDIPPLVIDKEVISYIRASLPMLLDETMGQLVDKYGLSTKDALTLVSLDAGNRLDYFYEVVSHLDIEDDDENQNERRAVFGRVAANWTLHELGGILNAAETPFLMNAVPAHALACIIKNLLSRKITGRTAKQLLSMVFNGEKRAVDDVIEEDDLKLETLPANEYQALAEEILAKHPDVVEKIQAKQQVGKVQFLVGQMIRKGEGKVEAEKAESVLRLLLQLDT